MLPQLAHYFLEPWQAFKSLQKPAKDAYIWKMGPQNPGLKDAIIAMGKAKRHVTNIAFP